MAARSHPRSSADADAADTLVCARADPDTKPRALALLLTGQAGAGEQAVSRFLAYSDQVGLDLTDLWVARRGDELRAAVLLVPSPGRASMLFLSPLRERSAQPDLRQLVKASADAQTPDRVRVIQALLDPEETHAPPALQHAGFDKLAELVYLQRRGPIHAKPLQLPDGMELVPWSEAQRPLFARAILGSYEGTRDCPALVGKRSIDDIIAGHRGTGTFDPRLWLAIRHGDRPVAVALVNRIEARDATELVYLGLTPDYRGRGLGRQLLDHMITLTHGSGAGSMLLAVDAVNDPARKLYRQAGFVPTGRKHAWVRFVGECP